MSKKLRLPVQGENKFVSKSAANISVIIPAYNRAGLIGETLRSLLNQTMPAKEIIVVDDGSTDVTAEAVEHEFSVFREQFSGNSKSNIQNPTFKVLRQANAGPGAARNLGLAAATGDFIHFFDSDDIAAPNKHEVQLRALLESGADIAYGPWVKGRFVNLTTTEHRGRCKMEQSQIGPKGEGVGTTESKDTESTEEEAVLSLGKPSSAAFSNPSTSELARDSESTSLTRCMTALALDARRSTLDSGPGNFVPEGPVLQARGLPKGDLIKALLTNWSIVPHACLFRRSILEKAGGFPEDIWVGEDQLLFVRCLLAGAKVVHAPGTMVFYRMGDDPGKLTAPGAAQKRHARDWAKFLVKANEEVSSAGKRVPAEAQRRGDFLTTIERQGGREKEQPQVGPKGEGVGMSESNYTDKHGYQRNQNGNAQGTCAGAAFSNPCTSELARDSENISLTRCVSGSAEEALRADYIGSGSAGGNQLADSKEFLDGQSQAGLQMDNQKDHTIRTVKFDSLDPSRLALRADLRSLHLTHAPALDCGSNSVTLDAERSTLDSSTPPAEWYGFRLRAYEAWRDLEKFFPGEENELKNDLQGIWKKNWFSGFRFQVSGFVFCKLGGLKLRVLGYREHASFRCGKFSVLDGKSGVVVNFFPKLWNGGGL